MLIAGALVFNYVVTIENIPLRCAAFHGRLRPVGPTASCCWSTSILLVLGCLLEGRRSCSSIVPIFIPTAKALGIDLVHFGVVVVVNIMIGLLTPPYGLLLFVLANMTKQPLGAIVREAAPFIVMAIVVLAIITAVPGDGALAAALHGLQRLNADDQTMTSRSTSSTAPTSTGSASASRRSTARRRWPRSRAIAARQPAKAAVEFRQSNSEAQLIDWIHEAIDDGSGIIINPAAFSFTSIAILDALKMFPGRSSSCTSRIFIGASHYHHS